MHPLKKAFSVCADETVRSNDLADEFRDEHKLVHNPKSSTNLDWFGAPKLMFGEGAEWCGSVVHLLV